MVFHQLVDGGEKKRSVQIGRRLRAAAHACEVQRVREWSEIWTLLAESVGDDGEFQNAHLKVEIGGVKGIFTISFAKGR